MMVMAICSLSLSVGIDSFTAHDEDHLKLQINKQPFLEYILQKYPCNVLYTHIFAGIKYYLITEIIQKDLYNLYKICVQSFVR